MPQGLPRTLLIVALIAFLWWCYDVYTSSYSACMIDINMQSMCQRYIGLTPEECLRGYCKKGASLVIYSKMLGLYTTFYYEVMLGNPFLVGIAILTGLFLFRHR